MSLTLTRAFCLFSFLWFGRLKTLRNVLSLLGVQPTSYPITNSSSSAWAKIFSDGRHLLKAVDKAGTIALYSEGPKSGKVIAAFRPVYLLFSFHSICSGILGKLLAHELDEFAGLLVQGLRG